MKFKLPHQILQQNLKQLFFKEIKKQKIAVLRVSKKRLDQIKTICKIIEKEELPKYLVRKKLGKGLGYGIFLHPKAKPIQKGDVIATYSGLVTLDVQNQSENESDYIFSLISNIQLSKEEQSILDPERKYHPKRLYSIDLDAENEGNFTRFINHSSDEPNIEAHLMQIAPKSELPPEIIYIASQTIRPGEQLLVCYEGDDKSYWGALNIKPEPISPSTFKLNTNLVITKN